MDDKSLSTVDMYYILVVTTSSINPIKFGTIFLDSITKIFENIFVYM